MTNPRNRAVRPSTGGEGNDGDLHTAPQLASGPVPTLPWDHPYESGPDMVCVTCGWQGSYAHTERFYRIWVWPALTSVTLPADRSRA